MKKYEVTIQGVSPYQQGRFHKTPPEERERPADYEQRTWKNKAHFDQDGRVFIPPMALKNALVASAAYGSKQIKGQGKKTYTAKFKSGVMINEPIYIGHDLKNAKPMWVFGSVTGKPGGKGGSRVEKCFPTFMEWSGAAIVYVLDEIITQEVLHEHFLECGRFIGLGVFRPENGGYYGRFEVIKIKEV